jgi:hypothetical protein
MFIRMSVTDLINTFVLLTDVASSPFREPSYVLDGRLIT